MQNIKGYNSNKNFGLRCENKIKNFYENKGWYVKQSPGSFGINDLTCIKKGQTHFVQVKGTRNPDKIPYISKDDTNKLNAKSKYNNAVPIIAKVMGNNQIRINNGINKKKQFIY
jgi:Holliday junction resolvase